MVYAINIDWQEEFKTNFEKWENKGRHLLEDNCKHKTQDKSTNNKETNVRYSGYCEECSISEDSCQPMMNYIYPLETTPSDEDILKVVKETNCTVMLNTETDEYFLTLCGGGMDLSQDVALSYILLEKWIPADLLTNVCKQKDFSISKKNYKILKREMIAQLQHHADNYLQLKKEWNKRK
jgi:hypothetical protein